MPPQVRGMLPKHHLPGPAHVCICWRTTEGACLTMLRRTFITGAAMAGLSACASVPDERLGPDGMPLSTVYRISSTDEAAVQFRMLDSVNALRQARGLAPVQFDARLNAAAKTHAFDMSLQNRPWLFGSDGSSPLDRAARVGYPGRLLGEVISESFESEVQTFAGWMAQEDTRDVILDPAARFMGFAWHQEQNGKLWWVLNMGSDPVMLRPIGA